MWYLLSTPSQRFFLNYMLHPILTLQSPLFFLLSIYNLSSFSPLNLVSVLTFYYPTLFLFLSLLSFPLAFPPFPSLFHLSRFCHLSFFSFHFLFHLIHSHLSLFSKLSLFLSLSFTSFSLSLHLQSLPFFPQVQVAQTFW